MNKNYEFTLIGDQLGKLAETMNHAHLSGNLTVAMQANELLYRHMYAHYIVASPEKQKTAVVILERILEIGQGLNHLQHPHKDLLRSHNGKEDK